MIEPKKKTTRRDLTGQRFGRLFVVGFAKRDKNRNAMWDVRCDCGTWKTVRMIDLVHGETVSCGCHRRSITTYRRRTPNTASMTYTGAE